jgi:hypothetical protein
LTETKKAPGKRIKKIKLYPGGIGKPPRKQPHVSAAMKALWASPEGKAKMAARDAKCQEDMRLNPQKYSRIGVPHGMTKATVAPLWAKAHEQADRFIEKMKDEGVLPAVIVPDSDDAKGVAALHAATVLALGPSDKQLKLAAIRTVLEWTRSKPAAKSNVTINTSEQWLAEIAAADDGAE